MLNEADRIKALAETKLEMPVLAVAGFSGDFTPGTMRNVASNVAVVAIDGIGHDVAMEAPDRLAGALIDFYRTLDQRS